MNKSLFELVNICTVNKIVNRDKNDQKYRLYMSYTSIRHTKLVYKIAKTTDNAVHVAISTAL